MNLLCPNCQKMLTVPEQFAGQLMKCPLCAGTFTVPGLPAAPSAPPPPVAPPPTPAPKLPPAPAAKTPPAPPPTPAPVEPVETYGLKQEPIAPPPQGVAPELALAPSLLGEPEPELPSIPSESAPHAGPSAGYQKMYAVYFSPKILQWVDARRCGVDFLPPILPVGRHLSGWRGFVPSECLASGVQQCVDWRSRCGKAD